jgi:hypothetical protein
LHCPGGSRPGLDYFACRIPLRIDALGRVEPLEARCELASLAALERNPPELGGALTLRRGPRGLRRDGELWLLPTVPPHDEQRADHDAQHGEPGSPPCAKVGAKPCDPLP